MTENGIGAEEPSEGTASSLLGQVLRIADAEQRIAAFHEVTGRPVVNLAIADNVLPYPSLKSHVLDKARVEMDDVRYKSPPYGLKDLRKHVTDLLHETFSPRIDADSDVCATAGVSGALESLAFALLHTGALEPGDGVMVPVPCWQGFRWCFEQRPGLRLVPVAPKIEFELTLQDVKDAYDREPRPPKLLVLTNPQNPLGVNFSRQLLNDICTWAMTKPDLHLVTDEIYAHSQIEGADPPFTTVLSLDLYEAHTDRIHLVWGLGKDFGLSGFRVGFLISKSKAVQDAVKGGGGRSPMAWFGPLDSLKNAYIRLLFPDGSQKPEWYPRALMQEYKKLLTQAHRQIAKELETQEIPYYGEGEPGRNPAQFFLLDLRPYLQRVPPAGSIAFPNLFPEIDDAEARLAAWIAGEANVQILPGQTQMCPQPGYFRLCYTAYPPDQVCEAVRAIRAALNKLPHTA
ncbi:pyridoxal phosphate-dependent aminotransferase [Actinomadura graeca]|uniref:Aminotransferase n=1 Tax=Actinomadura graeca TaxID=2750812 RepID=A0ABX8QVE2_9ACTN|nr:pyridoxal phosphate-dependent aminotransferase [Actinomadura graeca]QXJ22346.1 pyridoxal phosphate-dependent aminotransferase [Actinomadura graeca]